MLPKLLARSSVGLVLAATILTNAFVVGCSCDDARLETGAIENLVAAGQWSQVQQATDLTLGQDQDRLCPETRQALAEAGYEARMKLVVVKPHHQTNLEEEAAVVTAWHDAQAFARQYGLTANPPAEIRDLAYRLGYWQLSREAFVANLNTGSLSVDDPAQRAYYGSIMRNFGDELVQAGDRPDGLVALRIAAALGIGEATQDLQNWAPGQNWPDVPTDPVLLAWLQTRGKS